VIETACVVSKLQKSAKPAASESAQCANKAGQVKALIIKKPGQAEIESIREPVASEGDLLLKVRFGGFCGSDLNSFRGKNPMVTFPRIPGREFSATSSKIVTSIGRF
jgi:hypothetical protein